MKHLKTTIAVIVMAVVISVCLMLMAGFVHIIELKLFGV